MMNIVDILYSVPTLLYVILLMVILKPGLINIFIALGIGYWLQMARIVRGQDFINEGTRILFWQLEQ